MVRVFLITILLAMCLLISGCVYSSANVISAQGKDIMLVGMEGFIHVQDASVRIYRSQDSRSHKTDDPSFADRPNFIEKAASANCSIGTPKSIAAQKDNVPADNTVPALPVVK